MSTQQNQVVQHQPKHKRTAEEYAKAMKDLHEFQVAAKQHQHKHHHHHHHHGHGHQHGHHEHHHQHGEHHDHHHHHHDHKHGEHQHHHHHHDHKSPDNHEVALLKPKQKDDNDIIAANDWGTLIGTIIGFTPYIGSLAKSGFNMLWGKVFATNGLYVTQDEFTSELKQLYESIEKLIDQKLEQAEVDRLTDMFKDCQNRGNNFNDLLTLFTDNQTGKKGQLVNKGASYRVEPPAHLRQLDDDTLLQMIRSQFMDYRDFLEGAIIDMSNQKYALLLGNTLSMTCMIYVNLMRDCCLQGKGWGFPDNYIDGDGGNVKSMKENMHIVIQNFHATIAACTDAYTQLYNGAVFYPALNLPNNGYKLYGIINELDFIEYPNPIHRVQLNEYGAALCPIVFNSNSPLFKIDTGSDFFKWYLLDPHNDTVSGYQSGMLRPTDDTPSIKFSIETWATPIYDFTITFAAYSYFPTFNFQVKVCGQTFNMDSNDTSLVMKPRASYRLFNEGGVGKAITTPVVNANGATSFQVELWGPDNSFTEISSIEFQFLYSGSK